MLALTCEEARLPGLGSVMLLDLVIAKLAVALDNAFSNICVRLLSCGILLSLGINDVLPINLNLAVLLETSTTVAQSLTQDCEVEG